MKTRIAENKKDKIWKITIGPPGVEMSSRSKYAVGFGVFAGFIV